ncbi:MAG: hypothetical protein ACYTG2_17015 [Planctomycetota bacterium]|jgi:hypothetical protein
MSPRRVLVALAGAACLLVGVLAAGARAGPGDPGYRGGRSWIDTNGNEVPDGHDDFVHWPMLPPGRDRS